MGAGHENQPVAMPVRSRITVSANALDPVDVLGVEHDTIGQYRLTERNQRLDHGSGFSSISGAGTNTSTYTSRWSDDGNGNIPVSSDPGGSGQRARARIHRFFEGGAVIGSQVAG